MDTDRAPENAGPYVTDTDTPQNPGAYDVHLYALVRVKVSGIKAAGHLQAMEEAERRADLYGIFETLDRLLPDGIQAEYAEELQGYLVDETEGEELAGSVYYCSHRRRAQFCQPSCSCEERSKGSGRLCPVREILAWLLFGKPGPKGKDGASSRT